VRLLLLLVCAALTLAALELTPEERAYLKAHPVITFHNENDWKPYDYTENGVARGFCIDVVNLIAEKVGFRAAFISGKSWDTYMRMLRDGEIDVLHNTAKTRDREAYMLFSTSYITYKDALFVNRQTHEVKPLSAFEGKKIAVVRNYYQEELLKTYYPGIIRHPVDNSTESLRAVAAGSVDAAINEVGVGNNLISDHRLYDVVFGRIVEDPRFSLPLHLAVRNDNAVLMAILQKGLDAISGEEMMELQRKWLIMGPQEGFDFRTLVSILLGVGGLMALMAYRTRLLQKHNAQLQHAQNALKNEVAQKELLLRELNHRVKNNLQIISSIISLQAGKKEVAAVLEETENSIAAIALAYERLVYPESIDRIELRPYLETLLERTLHFGPEGLRRELEAPELSIDIHLAVTLGLIITECYNNCLKYAFDDTVNTPLFCVRIVQEARQLRVVICDNGRGFGPGGPDAGVGFELITALCNNRLHTRPTFYDDHGACIRILIENNTLS